MNETPPVRSQGLSVLLWVLLGAAAVLMLVMGVAVFLYWTSRKPAANVAAVPPVAANAPGKIAERQDFDPANAATILLGEDESGHGLKHLDTRSDGLTTIESIDGVSARVARLSGNRTEVYFYFKIDPAFKQEDVRRVRIDVEYLDPQPGTINIHYDALDAPNLRNAAYKDTASAVRMAGAGTWQRATFYTRNDAAFSNRQNGQADFRIYAKTPILYVRRVTVTREPVIEDSWTTDFSASNQVSILLGQEKPQDGLRHIADENDGRTTVVNLNGISCRHLALAAEGKFFGSFYFTISPSFKRAGLSNAVVEVEYLARQNNSFRLQFDGIQDGTNRSYVPVVPIGAQVVRRYGNWYHAMTPTLDTWSVATFHITNATFRNSQNGGADFRFEVIPPDMYVRRVIVRRQIL